MPVIRLGTLLLLTATLLILKIGADPTRLTIRLALGSLGLALSLILTAGIAAVMTHAVAGQESRFSSLSALTTYLATILGVGLFENIYSWGASLPVSGNPSQTMISGFQLAAKASIFLAVTAVLTALPAGVRPGSPLELSVPESSE